MQVKKSVITNLTRCYSLAEVDYHDRKAYLVASEKQYPCLLLSQEGQVLETVWDGPGGVMTMEPLPGGSFLATQRFYSPNDSQEACLVLATPGTNGWQVRTLCRLPFVHRFGLLHRDGETYLVACTLKSDHQFKEDWTCPGRIWVGQIPENLQTLGPENPLPLTPLVSGLFRNHGFFKSRQDGHETCLVAAENGIFRLTPPAPGGHWQVENLLEEPASDMLLADFDGDGQQEMLVFAPFHGDIVTIYKQCEKKWESVFEIPQPMPFLHALAVGKLGGRDVAVVGHRKGNRDLCLIGFRDGKYHIDVLDHDVGPANVLCREEGENLWVLSANREIDEVAMYLVQS